MSLCVLASSGQVDVLSVNRQQLRLRDGAVELEAIDVNCEPVTAPDGAGATGRGHHCGLHGYFGIDFVRTAAGPVVIEVKSAPDKLLCGLETRARTERGPTGAGCGHRRIPAAVARPSGLSGPN